MMDAPSTLRPRYSVAADLSIAVTEQLMALQEELAQMIDDEYGAEVRWVHPERVHVSLKYLGALPAPLLELLEERMQTLVSPLFPFQAESIGVELEPGPKAARLIWAGLDAKGGEVVGLLKRALEQELDKIGLTPDPRPFVPRLLLGRVRAERVPDMSAVVEEYEGVSFGVSTIKDLVLLRAEHRARGPAHIVVNRFALGQSD